MYMHVHGNVGLNVGSTARRSGELERRRFHGPGRAKAGFMEACTRMYISRRAGPSQYGGSVYTRVHDDFG
jgi:hypothetical protein